MRFIAPEHPPPIVPTWEVMSMMGFGFAWMVLVLVAAVAIALWLVQALFPVTGQVPRSPEEETPRAIARRRYAAGEITKEQYDDIIRSVT
jgi:uncharacterized membrane protein